MTPRVHPDRSSFEAAAAAARPGARVPVEGRVEVADPFEAYRGARDVVGGAYLATSGGQSGWGYFGVDPVDWLRVPPGDGDPLAALRDRVGRETIVRGACEVAYPAGALGWLSADLVGDLEELPTSAERERDLPWLQVALYDTLAA